MNDRYTIEVYAPGQCEDPPIIMMESSHPPLLPAVGDLINLRTFSHALESAECSIVRVISREHIFQPEHAAGKIDESKWRWQKVMLYTTKVDDIAETRVPGYPNAD